MVPIHFVGGPLHGKSTLKRQMIWHVQLPDPHHGMTRRPQVPKCLEIEEIKALTGSTGHRDFNRILREDFERAGTLARYYELKRFMREGAGMFDVYIFQGWNDEQAETAIRELGICR